MGKIFGTLLPYIITAIIVGSIMLFAYIQVKEEFELCNPNEKYSLTSISHNFYSYVDETHYNCCEYKTVLNDNGYYEEVKECKGFRKRPT